MLGKYVLSFLRGVPPYGLRKAERLFELLRRILRKSAPVMRHPEARANIEARNVHRKNPSETIPLGRENMNRHLLTDYA